MPQYRVPFYSQYTDLGHHEWRARGCGIASLAMVLAYWHSQDSRHAAPSIDRLLERGRLLGAYREGIGWSHGGLVNLAQEFGYHGYNADYAPNSPTPKTEQGAWEALYSELVHGPILTSVFAGFDPARGGGHIVVVTGFNDGLVYFNDSEERSETEGRRSLALDTFLRAYKRRFIVVRSKEETSEK